MKIGFEMRKSGIFLMASSIHQHFSAVIKNFNELLNLNISLQMLW